MTVDELLRQIMAAYAGATPEALQTFVPVFHKRLKHREGKHLQSAADEVFATFKAKYGQPFPIPADFEQHLPKSIFDNDPKKDPPIRKDLEEIANRRNINIQRWMEGQGAKIKANRPPNLYAACLLMAIEQCGRPSWRHLSSEQITECEHRAISQERVRQFGRLPEDSAIWWHQIGEVAAKLGFAPQDWQAWQQKKRPRTSLAKLDAEP